MTYQRSNKKTIFPNNSKQTILGALKSHIFAPFQKKDTHTLDDDPQTGPSTLNKLIIAFKWSLKVLRWARKKTFAKRRNSIPLICPI